MAEKLEGRRVLVVDDEPDVCDMVAEVLVDCDVDAAYTYDEAKEKLSSQTYDVVILDIMGVKGHELLDLYGQEYPCIMLTAHALTPESLKTSVKGHARLFLPKEELPQLEEYVLKVIKSRKPLWPWLLAKLDFRRWFGPDWSKENLLEGLTMDDIMADLEGRRD